MVFDTIISMNKIRLFFIIVITVVAIFWFLLSGIFYKSPPETEIDATSEFKITKISGVGKIYCDRSPFQLDNKTAITVKPVDIRHMLYRDELYLASDAHTSFEFYCFDIAFTVLPGSSLYYQPKTRGLYFYQGEMFWKKEVAGTKMEISLREAQNVLTLSEEGRIRIQAGTMEIWNYAGTLNFNYAGKEHILNAKQLLTVVPSSRPQGATYKDTITTYDIPASSQTIDPEEKIIKLDNDPNASVLNFSWGVVRGTPSYIFRLYSSELKENLLEERTLMTSKVTLDMLKFEERDFYWQVFPVESQYQKEGVPSKQGHVKMIGTLLVKKNVQKPPELIISSCTTNGSTVIIEGTADVTCSLLINDEPVTIDRDGGFQNSTIYKTIGKKTILIRLVSPLGVETVVEKATFIYSLD